MNDRGSPSSDSPPTRANVPFEASARRGFFVRFFTGTVSVLLGLVPAGIGLVFFLDPLYRKRPPAQADAGASTSAEGSDGSAGFVPLDVKVSSLPADGTPVATKVHSDRVDAWNRFADVEIGTIWLRRISDTEVVAFSATCPHLGCAVDYRGSRGDFFCPCHNGWFDLNGERTNKIPPRGMDRLDVKIDASTGVLMIRYQNFRAGSAEKKPIA